MIAVSCSTLCDMMGWVNWCSKWMDDRGIQMSRILLLLVVDRTWKALQNYWTRTYPSWDIHGGKKHWLSYRRVRSWLPFSLLFNEQFLAIFVTFAQFVALPMAFFTFLLYKSELLLIGTLFVVVQWKFLLLLRFLWTIRGPSLPFLMKIRCIFAKEKEFCLAHEAYVLMCKWGRCDEMF